MDERVQSLFMRQAFTVKETVHPNELNEIDTDDYDQSINSLLLNYVMSAAESKHVFYYMFY